MIRSFLKLLLCLGVISLFGLPQTMAQEWDDDLDVYETAPYSQKYQDNDENFKSGNFDYWEYQEPATTPEKTSKDKTKPVDNSAQIDDDLDVYETAPYSQEYQDNDEGYYYKGQGSVYKPIIEPNIADELDVYEQDIFDQPYVDSDQDYIAPENLLGDNDQIRTIYDELPEDGYNDYDPSQDYYPDYYDY